MSCILVVGSTGCGKSTSMRNLPLERTLYINGENKDLPFKSSKLAKHIRPKSAYEVLAGIKGVDAMDGIDYVVVDSISMLNDMFYIDNIKNADDTRSEWGNLRDYLKELIHWAKLSSKHFAFTGLVKEMYDGKELVTKKYCSVQGSMFQKIESEFTIVLEAIVEANDGKLDYLFCTNKTADNVGTPSKSPMGMFEELHIGNDLMEVFKKIEEYNKD